MAERRIINGYIVERQPDGRLVTIGPAGGTAPQMPANPSFPYEGPKAAADLTKTVTDNEIAIATKGDAIRKAKADADKAEADALKAARDAATATTPAELQKARAAQVQAAKGLHNQLDRVEDLYDKNFRNNGLGAIGEFNPWSQANRQFDAAANILMPFVKPLARVPGEGATDKSEYQDYRDLLPSGTSFDSTNDERILGLREMANSILRENGLPEYTRPKPEEKRGDAPLAAGNIPPAPQGPDRSNPIPRGPVDPNFDPTGKLTLGTGRFATDRDKQVQQQLNAMLNSGATEEQLLQAVTSTGYAPYYNLGKIREVVQYRDRGGKGAGFALPTTGERSAFEKGVNTALTWEDPYIGFSPGTAAASGVNALGAGTLEAIAPQAFDEMRANNPVSAFTGDVAGIVGATSAIGKIGAKVANRFAPQALTAGGRFGSAARAVAPDAVYGAAYGGITEGDPLTGAATATLGSAGGQLIGKGLQKGFQGVSDPAVQYLTARGVPLSLGETLGNNSIIGRQMQRMESIPILGDLMSARRGEARDAVYRGVLEDAVQPIGGRIDPADPLASAQQAISGAYDNAVGNVTVPFDARYFDELGNARNAASTLPPDLRGKFDAAMASRVDPISGQEIYYHGSPKTIEGPLMPGDGGRLGPGIYFTPDQKAAMEYAGEKGAEGVHQRIIRGQLAPDTEFNSLYGAVPFGQRPDPFSDEGKAYVNNVLQTLRDRGFVGIKGDDAYGNPSVNVIDPSALDLAAMSGQQYQQAMRGLSGYKSEATKPGFEQDYRDAISMVQDALKGQMMRGGGDTVVTGLRNADQAYSMLKPIQNATISARGTPTPKQLQAAFTTNTKKFGGDAAAARGDKVPDIVRYAVNNAPNIGNSGTADRLAGIMPFIMPTALGGSAVGLETFTDSPFLTGSLATLAALSTRTGQKAMQTALVKRPAAIRRAGGIFGRRETQKGLAGMVTAPLLIEQ